MAYRQIASGAAILLALFLVLALPSTGSGAPTCAEGSQRIGGTIVGTPCADRIVVPASVTYVDAGGASR